MDLADIDAAADQIFPGGIDVHTAPRIVTAGADILVAGNAVFGSSDPARAIHELRAAANAAVGS